MAEPPSRPGSVSLPGSVLFVCNRNRVRSPMAEGLMKRLFGARVYVDSCGLRAPRDAFVEAFGDDFGEDGGADPFAVAVMDEVGVDLTGHRAKMLGDLDPAAFDAVISLTPEAHHHALELARARAIEVDYWPTLDPTLAGGSRQSVLEAYRSVRDTLEGRLRHRFGPTRTFGG